MQLTQLAKVNKVKEVIVLLKKLNEAVVLIEIVKEILVLLKKAIVLLEVYSPGRQTNINNKLTGRGKRTKQNSTFCIV